VRFGIWYLATGGFFCKAPRPSSPKAVGDLTQPGSSSRRLRHLHLSGSQVFS
jgi:hypothetical protein